MKQKNNVWIVTLMVVMLLLVSTCSTFAEGEVFEGYIEEDQKLVEALLKKQIDGTDVWWNCNLKEKTMKFNGSGQIPSYYFEGASEKEPAHSTPWIEYAEDVDTIEFKEGITGIGEYCFTEFVNLKMIIFPESIEYIGNIFPSKSTGELIKITIKGYPMTEAESIAMEYGHEFISLITIKKGDINCDDSYSAEDGLSILKMSAKLDKVYGYTADITEDGVVNADDALEVLKRAAKIN